MNTTRYLAGRYIPKVALTVMVLVTLVAFASGSLMAQDAKPAFSDNHLIVQFAAGTLRVDIDAKAASWGMKVVKKVELPDTYLLERLPSRADVGVETLQTRAASDAQVLLAQYNYRRYPSAIPNDPRWVDMWGMRSIRADLAWDLQKGVGGVNVGVIDSGVYLAHEDLQGRLAVGRDVAGNEVGRYDDADDDPNPSRNATDQNIMNAAPHGTHVTGTIVAQGNNSRGVIGVCWDNVKVVPIKAIADDAYWFDNVDLLSALDYALHYNNDRGVDVVNMSLGGGPPSEVERRKIKELTDRGIVVCVAAGNDGGPVSYPAAYEECIAISSVGKTDQLAYYSNWGLEIDIAAPGGDQSTGEANGILSTYWDAVNGPGYEYFQGTSMACPHVAGAAALIISAGVPRENARERLQNSARRPDIGGVVDKRRYGAGIVDVNAAMRTSDGSINIVLPKDGAVIESGTVKFVVRLDHVNLDTVKIWINFADKSPADGIPDGNPELPPPTYTNNSPGVLYDDTTGQLTFEWTMDPGQGNDEDVNPVYNMYISGQKESGGEDAEVKDWCVFYISPRTIKAGKHLFSVPYAVTPGTLPEDIIKINNFTLKRYDAVSGRYLVYQAGTTSYSEAWPETGGGVKPHGSDVETPPTGFGFWLDNMSGDAAILMQGQAISNTAYDINLVSSGGGWNLIGNPFPFNVDWSNIVFKYQGRELFLDEAVKEGWIRPHIYSFQNGHYVFETAPYGLLEPWKGYWVRAIVGSQASPLMMIVPNLPSAARSVPATRAALTPGGWTLKLQASVGGSLDSWNFLGVASGASDGYDRQDVEEPPVDDGGVSLAFAHRDWGANSGLFTQDIRSAVGSGKTWEFEVSTRLANRDVQLAWPNLDTLPKGHRATLEDVDSGSKVFMATRSSYTYNSGNAGGVRHFRVRVEPESKGRLLVTGVTVTKNRGAGVTIAYSVSRDAKVEVKLRTASNKMIRTLGGNATRAAGLASVVWDGALGDGSLAPSGLYLCEIVATDADGELAKEVRPVLLR